MCERSTITLKGLKVIRKMVHIQSKLEALDIVLPNVYIVPIALNSLLVEFSQIKQPITLNMRLEKLMTSSRNVLSKRKN